MSLAQTLRAEVAAGKITREAAEDIACGAGVTGGPGLPRSLFAKFAPGAAVACSTRKHGRFPAVVVEVHKAFAETDSSGAFRKGGLVTDERDIPTICIPHRFDGETLEVDYPEAKYAGGWSRAAHTVVSKFYGYSYTVRDSRGQLYLVSEDQCRRAK